MFMDARFWIGLSVKSPRPFLFLHQYSDYTMYEDHGQPQVWNMSLGIMSGSSIIAESNIGYVLTSCKSSTQKIAKLTIDLVKADRILP